MKMGILLTYFTAREFRASSAERPAGLVACLAMTWEVIAAQRRPRNNTMRRIKLHEGSTEPIISEIIKMDVP